MDFSLLERALEAEEVAGGLQVFLDNVPRSGTHISANMGKLFVVSSTLRSLESDLANPRFGLYAPRIMPDINLVLHSFGLTLDSLKDMFSQSRYAALSGRPYSYGPAWDSYQAKTTREGSTLSYRMDLYSAFLNALTVIIRGADVNKHVVRRLRQDCTALVQRQEPFDAYFNRLTLDANDLPPPRRQSGSYFQNFNPFNSPPMTPSSSDGPGTPFAMPPAPEVPQSPISNSSQQTYSSAQTFSTNSSGNSVQHWAAKVFDGRHTKSEFPTYGQSTRCYGRDEPGLIEKLAVGGYRAALEVSFTADLVVRFYWRPQDLRARLVHLEKDPSTGQRCRYSLPMTSLRAVRSESCLQLQRVNAAGGPPELWANYRFPYYERMVLFYAVFSAMKCQDAVQPPDPLEDHFQVAETMEFAGRIESNNSLYAFRVYRDPSSGCVRFEVTAYRGPFTRIPIWVAFVTQYIGVPGWMRLRSDGRTVSLRELHPYLFCENFLLPKGPSGAHELRFSSVNDADNFCRIFHRIPIE